jgi:hypothetical protein
VYCSAQCTIRWRWPPHRKPYDSVNTAPEPRRRIPLRDMFLPSCSQPILAFMMAKPGDVIADAFGKLKRSISEEDAHNFASIELKDVFSAVRDIDSRQRKRQSAQNLRRAETLLRGLEKYTKVIEVLCNGTPYLPYIWVRPHSPALQNKSSLVRLQ